VLSFACAFLATLALVRDWTGSWVAAVVAGALFAFSPFRAANLGELHILGNYYLPLVALAARRAIVTPGVRWPALLATVLVLQALHSYYLGYAAFFAAVTMAAVVLAGDAAARRRWVALVAPIAVAGVIVALSALPYVQVAATFAPPSPRSCGSTRLVPARRARRPPSFSRSRRCPFLAARRATWRRVGGSSRSRPRASGLTCSRSVRSSTSAVAPSRGRRHPHARRARLGGCAARAGSTR
jgi:hypothetical protein